MDWPRIATVSISSKGVAMSNHPIVETEVTKCRASDNSLRRKVISTKGDIDEGELWSWIRDVLSQGGDIWIDHQNKSYEQYSSRLDAAAHELVVDFRKLVVVPTEGDAVATLREIARHED
jgi:hypothetical protein